MLILILCLILGAVSWKGLERKARHLHTGDPSSEERVVKPERDSPMSMPVEANQHAAVSGRQ